MMGAQREESRAERLLRPRSLRSQLTLAFATTSLVVVGIAALVLVMTWQASPLELGEFATEALALALLVSLGIAAVAGLLVGLLMAKLIRGPLESLTSTLYRHGHEALEGHAPGEIEGARRLPEEFHSLIAVFNSLLDHLSRRRAETLAAEEEAEAAARNLAFAVFDSSEAKILLRDDVVILANPAAAALLGVPATGLVDMPVSAFESAVFATESGEFIAVPEMVAAALQRPVRICVTRADSTQRWADVRAVGHAADHATLLVTGRDVTEERRAQELRHEVISLVSHDLRAPLTVITGYLDLLERPLDDDRRVAAVTAARVSAERMSALIEDILSATRAEELFAPASFAPVDLVTLAGDVVDSLEHTTSHRLRAQSAGAGVVLGEERRLRQAVVNLVTNAIRHTPADCEITVKVGGSADHVLLAVEDTGSGVPPQDRERIFERFLSLEDRGGAPGGFGLGLYIVKAIVESHGGRVWVEDRPDGPGARFVISLTAAPADPHVRT